MKGLATDENISNLTSASGEISASSRSRIETSTLYSQQSFPPSNQSPPPPPKKKRNLPGNPDPEAEVIALSPKTLLATNRFICEICNKGFQRDQNLQLHRRGHNLPWKLKQRTNKEVRKKVYVCPEATCVHHDPSRALGDLTGIKKHFSRKHGEKKWKCEKCSKRYAVQSDWKAHSKICGTREYRCDCGTLFSRRDSFITHRAFCDALAEESAKAIPLNPSSSSTSNHMINLQALSLVKREQESHHHLFINNNNRNVPPWLVGEAAPAGPNCSQLFPANSNNLDQAYLQNDQNPSPNPNLSLPRFQPPVASAHMSATALLQKAAQMGVTMSCNKPSLPPSSRPHKAHMSETTTGFSSTSVATSAAGSGLNLSSSEDIRGGCGHGLTSFANKAASITPPSSLVQDMMTCLSSASGFDGSSSFDEELNGILMNSKKDASSDNIFQETLSKSTESQFSRNEDRPATHKDGLTRDFLGLKAFSHKDFLNVAAFAHINSSSTYEQRSQNQPPWQG